MSDQSGHSVDGTDRIEEPPVCPDCEHWVECCACDELFAEPEPWEGQP